MPANTLARDNPIPDLSQALVQRLGAPERVRTDLATRYLYSTDASIYQIQPLGVVWPRSADELQVVVELAGQFAVPVLARGAGSSLAGQAIGAALIVDCSKYLTRLVEINPEELTASVEPGLVLAAFNQQAARWGLKFGPDPASAERATLGGSLANNATGAHSIVYGMAADHLLEADVVLADGSLAHFAPLTLAEAGRRAQAATLEGSWYAAALRLREQYGDAIRQRWPRTFRRASGYNLNYLLPWSAAAPPLWEAPEPYPPVPAGMLNLAPLLAGSEGTLALLQQAKVRLVRQPAHTLLAVLAFDNIPAACDAVPGLLECRPTAIELIPASVIQLARSVPAYAHGLDFVPAGSKELLVVELSGEDAGALEDQARRLFPGAYLALAPAAQARVWAVRKVGLGLMQSRPGDYKPLSFVEDLSVPVEHLGAFVREMERILAAHGTHGEIYAHASAGCLHIRPILSLKSAQGVADLRSIAAQAVALTIGLGGAVSGEHGDGLARSEWHAELFGPELLQAFRELKQAADPHNLLNPGKIVALAGPGPRMDQNLRFGAEYQAAVWSTRLDFSAQAGLDGAVEQCNGAGVCRKGEGVMCPSFQATQDEMHSTRGRANLLRALLAGHFPAQALAQQAVYQALDLCLACKGCKAECPSAVDMAKLKYEFLDHYYAQPGHHRRLRDYLFGYIGPLARLGQPLGGVANALLATAPLQSAAERWLGLDRRRPLPRFSRRSLGQQLSAAQRSTTPFSGSEAQPVLLLVDAFNEYFYPEVGLAALQLLQAAGCQVRLLPLLGAGRTLISKGFLEPARRHASNLLAAVRRLDPHGRAALLGLEPSEIYTLRDEYPDLLPGDPHVAALSRRAWMLDEYLLRPAHPGAAPLHSSFSAKAAPGSRVLLHAHCYQKARPPAEDAYPVGAGATLAALRQAGYQVQLIEAGCCGMAGAFGYEAEHYQLSLQVAELSLLPAVRAASPGTLIAASGVSCQAQIEDGAARQAQHPVRLLAQAWLAAGLTDAQPEA